MVENHHPAIVSPERQAAVGVILESKRYNKNATYQRKKRPRLRRALHLRLLRLHDGRATTDKVRADGWRPPMYICSRRRKSEDCTNKYVSDVTLGPFVLNFFANLIKASNSFRQNDIHRNIGEEVCRVAKHFPALTTSSVRASKNYTTTCAAALTRSALNLLPSRPRSPART